MPQTLLFRRVIVLMVIGLTVATLRAMWDAYESGPLLMQVVLLSQSARLAVAVAFTAGLTALIVALLLLWGRRAPSAPDGWAGFAPDVVVHNLPPALTPTLDGGRQYLALLHAAFPDVHFTTEDQITEGDRKVVRTTVHGSHTGILCGALVNWPSDIPPTGRTVTWTEMAVYRSQDGQIVEIWDFVDRLDLLQQLGVVSAGV